MKKLRKKIKELESEREKLKDGLQKYDTINAFYQMFTLSNYYLGLCKFEEGGPHHRSRQHLSNLSRI